MRSIMEGMESFPLSNVLPSCAERAKGRHISNVIKNLFISVPVKIGRKYNQIPLNIERDSIDTAAEKIPESMDVIPETLLFLN